MRCQFSEIRGCIEGAKSLNSESQKLQFPPQYTALNPGWDLQSGILADPALFQTCDSSNPHNSSQLPKGQSGQDWPHQMAIPYRLVSVTMALGRVSRRRSSMRPTPLWDKAQGWPKLSHGSKPPCPTNDTPRATLSVTQAAARAPATPLPPLVAFIHNYSSQTMAPCSKAVRPTSKQSMSPWKRNILCWCHTLKGCAYKRFSSN